jgi:hypothetical protein
MEVSQGGGHFSFAVPVDPGDVDALYAVTLTGPEGAATMDRSAGARPAALVRDGASGEIRAIVREGTVPPALADGSVVTSSLRLSGEGPE